MQNDIKSIAQKFLLEYGLKQVTLESLRSILKNQGYTIVEFNAIVNDPQVAALVTALGLEQNIQHSKGFTYADRYRRLVFLNEDLSDDEKLVVLAHEEGHIYCDHFSAAPVLGKDVVQEHEANEFSHYILNPTFWQKCHAATRKNRKKVLIWILVCALFVLAGLAVWSLLQEQGYYGDFYLTPSGNKYHIATCSFVKDKTSTHRMTVEEFESGDYTPCSVCMPEEAAEEKDD